MDCTFRNPDDDRPQLPNGDKQRVRYLAALEDDSRIARIFKSAARAKV